jgi:hypothetical protein
MEKQANQTIKNLGFPDPSDIWDGIVTESGEFLPGSMWSDKAISQFCVQMFGLANWIIYAEQGVIDRVVPYIQTIIDKIKAREISEEEGLKLTHTKHIFSKTEFENIHREYKNDGGMLESFYENKGNSICQ